MCHSVWSAVHRITNSSCSIASSNPPSLFATQARGWYNSLMTLEGEMTHVWRACLKRGGESKTTHCWLCGAGDLYPGSQERIKACCFSFWFQCGIQVISCRDCKLAVLWLPKPKSITIIKLIIILVKTILGTAFLSLIKFFSHSEPPQQGHFVTRMHIWIQLADSVCCWLAACYDLCSEATHSHLYPITHFSHQSRDGGSTEVFSLKERRVYLYKYLCSIVLASVQFTLMLTTIACREQDLLTIALLKLLVWSNAPEASGCQDGGILWIGFKHGLAIVCSHMYSIPLYMSDLWD